MSTLGDTMFHVGDIMSTSVGVQSIVGSLYIYHCSIVVDFSSEKYSGSTGRRNAWYQHRNLQ